MLAYRVESAVDLALSMTRLAATGLMQPQSAWLRSLTAGQASLLGKQGTAVANATSTACGELSKLGHGLSNDIFNLGDEIVFRLRQVAGTMNQCSTALD